MTGERNGNNGDRLTDEELARLLEPDLDPAERAGLVERLHGDPDAAKVLALAATEIPRDGPGLSETTVDNLLETVHSKLGETGICPHCAGDLHHDGTYCPHCGSQVRGNTIICVKCAKPVKEGSAYCPHCGSFFRPAGHKGVIGDRLVLFVLGLASILAAAVTYSVYRPLVLFFVILGCLALGGWLWSFFETWRARRESTGRIPEAGGERDEKRVDRKKTG